MSHSQQLHVAAAAQLLDQEGGVGEGRSAVTEVVQEVQVLHQSEPVDQVRAGEMRQLRRLCGERSDEKMYYTSVTTTSTSSTSVFLLLPQLLLQLLLSL